MSLKLVTLPIGNTGDITLRAKLELENAKLIYAEDTRVLKDFLSRIEIRYADKTIISFHDHTGENKLKDIIEKARTESIVFVSDAGSPVISDPGFDMARMAIEMGVVIESISGISSPIVALELSGLPPIPFHFHGFLGRQSSHLREQFSLDRAIKGTHIYFEGNSRVIDTLEIMCTVLEDLEVVVAKELTKSFETVYRFRANEFSQIKNTIDTRGEFVVLFYTEGESSMMSSNLKELAKSCLEKNNAKNTAKLIAEILGRDTKEIYNELSRK